MEFLFGQGRLSLDEGGVLKVPKPEPLEIDENDQCRMLCARVLEGDLPLVTVTLVLHEPSVGSEAPRGCGGLKVIVDDAEEFVEDVAGELRAYKHGHGDGALDCLRSWVWVRRF